jgi:hypothetical protein
MRDYKREYTSYHSKPAQKKNRAGRNSARRKKNLSVMARSANRSKK